MEKIRVYELAKELNTTSKRLIEKMEEINIFVKNHMSLLEKEQIDALYKHIGLIKHAEDKSAEAVPQQKAPAPAPAEKKDIRRGPTIIRKTEIIVDSNGDRDIRDMSGRQGYQGGFKNDHKKSGKNKDKLRDYVKVADDTSGLRAGFVRSRDHELKKMIEKEIPKQQKPVEEKKEEKKEEKVQVHPAAPAATIPAQDEKKEVRDTEKPKESIEQKATVQKTTTIEDKSKQPDSIKPDEVKDAESKKDMDVTVKKEAAVPGQVVPEKREDVNKGAQQKDRIKKPRDSAQQVKKPLEIPMPEMTAAQKEELAAQRKDNRREYQNKDSLKEIRKEVKKEVKKDSGKIGDFGKKAKFSPRTGVLAGKKHISEVLSEDFILEEFYDDEGVKKVKKPPKQKKDETAKKADKHIPHKAVLTTVKIGETITVKELAEVLKKTSTEVIKKLMSMGLMLTVNEVVDFDTAAIIADEFGVTAEKAVEVREEDILFDESEDKEEDLVPRPPVVVVMGHVDHGKTSLLDAIKETHVTETEAGGITQHIGAYMVDVKGRKITFLDTPGHEAFTAMRARGAQVTDIAILVVAADDGVMPQTVEAINHAKAANVNIIVAINKIDKPGANPDRVKQELTEYGLLPEEWGGDVICVNVSALKRQNIDTLLEMILLSADMLELKANPKKQAKGTIIEAKLDKGRGAVATLLVQRGTLKVGDLIIAGTTLGRIRAMVDDKGNDIREAGPSTPVEVIGLSEVPEAGEVFYQVEDEKLARSLAERRKEEQREQHLKASSRVSLEDLFSQIQEGKVKDLNIIVKADVQGSVEAVKQSLEKLSNDEVRIKIIHGGVGAITESDVNLAQVSNAIIIGFNVRPGANVAEAAENAKVDIRLYRIIYEAIEDIEAAIKGMLEPTYKEVVLGHAEIRQIFKVSGVGTIGGSYVLDGKITRNADIRVIRDGIVVHEGKLASLKRFKDDVREVMQGYECGLSIEKFNDIKEGDIIESYMMEEVKR